MAAQGAVAGALAQHRQRLQEARGCVSQDGAATRDRAWRRMQSSRMEVGLCPHCFPLRMCSRACLASFPAAGVQMWSRCEGGEGQVLV